MVALAGRNRNASPPDVVIVLYDDLGYGDLGYTGSTAIKTPNIDALARDGVVLSNFHSASAVCSPSRAGFLTWRLPPRAGVPSVVFQSDSPNRLVNYAQASANSLPAEEITIADVLKADGYRTAKVGKWHLGDRSRYLPNDFRFDSFLGSLYSNDMTPFAIWKDRKIAIAAPADQTRIDRIYTDEAVRIIQSSAASPAPILLYFAHNFPHEPLFAAPERQGISSAGLYGDVVESLDAGIGRIVDALKRTGRFDNTIIIITTDNGPWFQGSPGTGRGRKGQSLEGGKRVPFLIYWPARLRGHRAIDAMAMGTDVFPTLLDWLGLPLPDDRYIDGASLAPLLEGRAAAAHEFNYFYSGNGLMAVSDGRFKFMPRQPYPFNISGSAISRGMTRGPCLFDLASDPGEDYDVLARQPLAARRLEAAYKKRNVEMEKNLKGWKPVGPTSLK